jgi:hypothetical protein
MTLGDKFNTLLFLIKLPTLLGIILLQSPLPLEHIIMKIKSIITKGNGRINKLKYYANTIQIISSKTCVNNLI